MRSPLWLKRFELDKAGNQLHTVAAKADSIEVFNVAPAYIEDGDLGTRVVVDVHVWADISYQPEPQITGKLRVIGGHNAEEIPKYSGLSRVDQAVYRIFFEKEFKATLQEVEQLADTENKPKSNMKLSKGDSKK
jgi:hypothetical protein